MDCAWLCEVANIERTDEVSERAVNDRSDGIGVGFRCRVGFHAFSTSFSERSNGVGCFVGCRNCCWFGFVVVLLMWKT